MKPKDKLITYYVAFSLLAVFFIGDDTPLLAMAAILLNLANSVRLANTIEFPETENNLNHV